MRQSEVVLTRKVVPCISNYPYVKFGESWTSGRPLFSISKIWKMENHEKIRKALGPIAAPAA
jgi:hypothetical protein